MARPPKHYEEIKSQHPQVFQAIEALGQMLGQAGPIDVKTAQLIQLAAAVAQRSEGAVHSHTRRALEAGASADEVVHAVMLLTSTVGLPTMMAALSWTDDILEGD